MNYRLIFYLLGLIALFIGASMALALPWALPIFGGDWEVERAGVLGLVFSMLFAFSIGAIFYFWGQKADKQLLYKESMAVVPLCWILAILLGAMPYYFSGTQIQPDEPMSVIDAIFESSSGLTTTGATVLCNVEDSEMVPRTILFWRAMTHFLGGLGIMVLFVVILGQGVIGKTIMKIEKGSGSSGSSGRMRQLAASLAYIYMGMIAVLTVLLVIFGLSPFDAICHAFSTMATGGFSTFNGSIGHFAAETGLDAGLIEGTIIFFMIVAGSNFLLLYYFFAGEPKKLFGDLEWRTFLVIIAAATFVVFVTGLYEHDFDSVGTCALPIAGEKGLSWPVALRQSLFQVVSMMTSTGFCTDEFEQWNGVSLLVFVFLMFVGGCAGSTAGGTKIIRNIIAWKAIRLETERSYRPNVVRTIKIDEEPVEKSAAFAMITFLLLFIVSVFLISFLALLFQPNAPWFDAGRSQANKMLDLFSASLSMHSNIGPGFGLVGARENYALFAAPVKLIFAWAMLLGRLELYLPFLIFLPNFWRKP